MFQGKIQVGYSSTAENTAAKKAFLVSIRSHNKYGIAHRHFHNNVKSRIPFAVVLIFLNQQQQPRQW